MATQELSRGGLTPTLNTAQGGQRTPCVFQYQAIGKYKDEDLASTQSARDFKSARDLVLGGRSETFCLMDQEGGSVMHVEDNLTGTLRRETHGHEPAVISQMQVRRLTPVECERLQGFPDGHTLVPHRVKPAADGPRYKALGNSMAVPVIEWIGRRIAKCYPNGL